MDCKNHSVIIPAEDYKEFLDKKDKIDKAIKFLKKSLHNNNTSQIISSVDVCGVFNIIFDTNFDTSNLKINAC